MIFVIVFSPALTFQQNWKSVKMIVGLKTWFFYFFHISSHFIIFICIPGVNQNAKRTNEAKTNQLYMYTL